MLPFIKLQFLLISIDLMTISGDLFCSEQLCQSYREQRGCPQLSLGCQIQNETLNGEVFPAAEPCNCCNLCLENIEEGGYCTIGSTDTAPPVYACGPGLYCQKDEQDDDYKCRKMTESACFKEQIAYDTLKNEGKVGTHMQRPNCNGDGNYQPIKCHLGQTCFCANENGERIFGESQHSLYTEMTMKCECSRLNNKLATLLPSRFPIMSARCLEDGSFDPLQCMEEKCFCVDPSNGFSVTDLFNVLEVGFAKLPCFNASIHRKSRYLHDCEVMQDEYIESFQESESDRYTVMKGNDENCQPDGWFWPVQQNSTHRYCVDKYGRLLNDYVVLKKDSNDMNCLCPRTVNIMKTGETSELAQCCPNGNFKSIQCRQDKCFCVDKNGLQITKEVNSTQLFFLPCYSSKKGC